MQLFSAIDPEIDKNIQTIKKSKNRFTEEEDNIIIEFVQNYGAHTWRRIMPLLPGRTPRQIRERYVNYLSPNVNRDAWTKEEDNLIMKLVSKFGKKWAYIAQSFNQRTDVSIKNRYILLKRKEQKEIRNNLLSKISKKNISQLENHLNNQFQPNFNLPAGNYQTLEYSNPLENKTEEEQSSLTQQSIDLETNGITEEQNYHIEMFDLDNDFPINDDFLNDFDFQFFA